MKPSAFPLLLTLLPALCSAQPSVPPAPLTFAEAWQRVRVHDPVLRGLELESEAAEGLLQQAALPPNPQLSAEIENVAGTGTYRGADAAELTLGVSQLLERGGKRRHRTAVATAERDAVAWQRARRLSALRLDTRLAFAAVLLGQERVSLRRDRLGLAEQSVAAVGDQVRAGIAPAVELTRARLAVAEERTALAAAAAALEGTRAALAALWLQAVPDFGPATGDVALPADVPSLESLLPQLPASPELAAFTVEARRREAAVALEEARARPDLVVSAGLRGFRDGRDAAFVLGAGIPWPVRDRNQGNLRAARARLARLATDEAAVRAELQREFVTAYHALVAAHQEAGLLARTVLPAAEETRRETEARYRDGRYTLLNVLEARQTLAGVRSRLLDAQGRYFEAFASLERLTRPADLNQP